MHMFQSTFLLQGLDMATGELRIVVKVVHDDTFAARIGIFGQYELAGDQQVRASSCTSQSSIRKHVHGS